DLPPRHVPGLEALLRKMARTNSLMYWNSHHAQSQEHIDMVTKQFKTADLATDDVDKCSAELFFERFLRQDKVARDLAAIAHDIEFWERNDALSGKLADLIQAGQGKHLIEPLSRGVTWSESQEDQWKAYLEKKEKELAAIVKRAQEKPISTTTIAFSHASCLVSSADAGDRLLAGSKADVTCIVFSDGRIFFRRREGCELDLRPLAEMFSGGGQVFASGGVLPLGKGIPKQVKNDTWKDIQFYVERQLADHFDKA
ncbi:hypothetical protein COV94_02310, partial [Candidatus Woesearchaeota archaeon CG11_big_fil_rev_8_21_14_0_20_57_5]